MFTPSISTFMSREGACKGLQKAGFSIINMHHDRQSPTISKVLGHSKLHVLHPIAQKLHIDTLTFPIALPIPGIFTICARKKW